MENLLRDLRYGIRILLRHPVATGAAVLSLALGIGANTAIFSLINALLWPTLPVEEQDRLVTLYMKDVKNPDGFFQLSHFNWQDYRRMSRSFSGVLGYDWAPVSLQSGEEPVHTMAQLVSGNYFELLGVRAAQGRTFRPSEDGAPGTHPVAVVSYRFWEELLGGAPDAVGKAITLNGSAYTVIGVAPRGFRGLEIGFQPELWIPMAMNRQIKPDKAFNLYGQRRGLTVNAVGRLEAGITLEQAQAEIDALSRRLERDHPDDNRGRSVVLVPLSQATLLPRTRVDVITSTKLLLPVTGLVLLIACANVSNLLLAHAAARRREIAIRFSQGAERGRLARQFLTESLLLAGLGGALGLLIALWVQRLLPELLPIRDLPLGLQLPMDLRVLAFTLAVSLLTGVLFGLAPALRATQPELLSILKNQTKDETGSLRSFGLRGALASGQVALSLVALIAAGLFLRSLGEMRQVDLGFPVDRLALLSFDVGLQGWDRPRAEQFYREVQAKAAAVPGVAAAALAQDAPFHEGAFARSVFLKDRDVRADGVLVQVNTVGPHYFATLGVPIVRGRAFTDDDHEGAPRVVIINQTMAAKYWPGQNPIGRRFHFFREAPVEVVGVARDMKYNYPLERPQPYIYEPLAQRYTTGVTLIVRAERDPAAVLPKVREVVRAMAPTMPLVETGEDLLSTTLLVPQAWASLLSMFGLLGLGLAAVGIYGVMSYSVAQKWREIGLRMALGAQPRDVVRLVLRQGLAIVAAGLATGLVLAFALTRFAAGLLFEVSPTDPTAFGITSAILALTAFAATLVPALRAVSIDPLVALRYE